MLPQVLPKSRFKEFVIHLMAHGGPDGQGARLVAPTARGPQFAFAEIEGPGQVDSIRMDYDITILPPKKYMVPQYEALLEFSGANPRDARGLVECAPTVILGVHPYDLHAIATLDAAYAMNPSDPHYQARRQATALVGLNIDRGYINEHQFMADMGTLEAPAGGCQLFLTDLGDHYFIEIGNDRGAAIISQSGLSTPARKEDYKAKQDFDARKPAGYPKRLPYDTRYLPELLNASYDSLLWDAVARRCFSCGTCTNVCPTCYCFDIQDKLNIDAASGIRQRKWDSCQLRSFAEVAGGENFREQRASRLRHRMFRKGKFVLERTGRLGCVGCGRCIYHCVADISILEAFQQIGEGAVLENG